MVTGAFHLASWYPDRPLWSIGRVERLRSIASHRAPIPHHSPSAVGLYGTLTLPYPSDFLYPQPAKTEAATRESRG